MLVRRNPARMLAPVLLACAATPVAAAEWQPDHSDPRQVSAATAIAEFRERIAGIDAYFDDAYGFAILPSITRVGLGVGGAYGRGIVIDQNAIVGTTGYWQFTSGIQAGAKYFSMIVFFRDQEASDRFKKRELEFMGQAGLALATVGAASTPSYNEGIAVFTVTRFGLMGEFTISGARFTYRPLTE